MLPAGRICCRRVREPGTPSHHTGRPAVQRGAAVQRAAGMARRRRRWPCTGACGRRCSGPGSAADWQDPRLAAYASGAALSTLVSGLYSAARQGIVIKGTIGVNPQVVSVSAARVLVTDCVNDTHWLNYVAATGKLQNSAPGGRHLTEAVVTDADGRWTVSQLAVRQAGTC